MSTTKIKDNKEEKCQYYNLLRNYDAQNTEIPPKPPGEKAPHQKLTVSPQTYGQLGQKSAETVRPTKNSPPRNHAKSPHFTYHKETSQPICNANQLTGFHKRRAPITKYSQNRLSPALRSLSKLSQITETSANDR